LESLTNARQFWHGIGELDSQRLTQLFGKTVALQTAAKSYCHTLIEFVQ